MTHGLSWWSLVHHLQPFPRTPPEISSKGQPMSGPINRRSDHGLWSRVVGQIPNLQLPVVNDS
ncbi:hypothetical protein MTR67_019769 [Solanum verrucosum]|uniref:Uncharacterized protein n=1 Tax=Solanum verrucosum TaxID=315347 RepID=A0AAF0QM33_SOLVR|nr:hypothetical protein MTR67_019769 [Solanum verrucosum]